MIRIGFSPSEFEEKDEKRIKETYIAYAENNGFKAFCLESPFNKDEAKKALEDIDVLILTGGCDVDPGLYGEEAIPELGKISKERDQSECLLLSEALDKNLPIMGICRGLQLINVYFGGSLYQDIYAQNKDVTLEHRTIDLDNPAYHEINIIENTIFQMNDHLKENVFSYHHQAIKQLGNDLEIGALSPDGLIEAIYHKKRNLIAVQWHPERMHDEYSSYLLKTFINNSL